MITMGPNEYVTAKGTALDVLVSSAKSVLKTFASYPNHTI